MDVTHPRLLDAEGTDSTFPQNVGVYWPPQHIITQDLNLRLHSCLNQIPETDSIYIIRTTQI
jgi:hypothetical protein